ENRCERFLQVAVIPGGHVAHQLLEGGFINEAPDVIGNGLITCRKCLKRCDTHFSGYLFQPLIAVFISRFTGKVPVKVVHYGALHCGLHLL
ncbi:MAG: hypothetical protein NC124_19550, partial [Clostridium sp.]|nr:hypothetical protein [Clostridium sp.]